jgi:hypothetical protein
VALEAATLLRERSRGRDVHRGGDGQREDPVDEVVDPLRFARLDDRVVFLMAILEPGLATRRHMLVQLLPGARLALRASAFSSTRTPRATRITHAANMPTMAPTATTHQTAVAIFPSA